MVGNLFYISGKPSGILLVIPFYFCFAIYCPVPGKYDIRPGERTFHKKREIIDYTVGFVCGRVSQSIWHKKYVLFALFVWQCFEKWNHRRTDEPPYMDGLFTDDPCHPCEYDMRVENEGEKSYSFLYNIPDNWNMFFGHAGYKKLLVTSDLRCPGIYFKRECCGKL